MLRKRRTSAGRESRTAVAVCATRALAHGQAAAARFEDPTALALLPDHMRRRIERLLEPPSSSLRERIGRWMFAKRIPMIAARTIEIDDAVRAARSPQLVILGAGLDGRAWRMPELADVTVFEVDHPDSQREKRSRAASLQQRARAVRFVPVDFERDRLDDALAAAGHDAALPTTWIWEGVIMYLSRAAVEATLRVVAARSAPGSALIVLYASPMLLLRGALRSLFDAHEMRALVGQFGFDVDRDRDLGAAMRELAGELSAPPWEAKHLRIAAAHLRARGA